MSKIYHYSPITGEFTVAGIADPSPMEENVWLVPAYATEDEPPEAPAGHRAVWQEEQWSVLPDLRGTVVWLPDGSTRIIDQLGPLPDNATTDAPSATSVEDRRAQRDALIEQSDWTQLVDTLLDDPELKTAWADYRSRLRRIDLDGAEWPVPPIVENTAS